MSSSATPSAITNNNLKTLNIVERRRNPPGKMEKGKQFGAIKHINTSYFLKGEDFFCSCCYLYLHKKVRQVIQKDLFLKWIKWYSCERARSRERASSDLGTSGLSVSGVKCKVSDVADQAAEVEDRSNVCFSGFTYVFFKLQLIKLFSFDRTRNGSWINCNF